MGRQKGMKKENKFTLGAGRCEKHQESVCINIYYY